jgi:hypothetical protein
LTSPRSVVAPGAAPTDEPTNRPLAMIWNSGGIVRRIAASAKSVEGACGYQYT